MRPLLLSAILFLSCARAFSASYGEKLVEYYGFEIEDYGGGFVWCWRNPETGVRIFHRWSSGAKTTRETLEQYPVIVTYRVSDSEPVFWVHYGAYDKYVGYAESSLLADEYTYVTAGSNSASPLDEVFLLANGLRSTHPDEYDAPERPDPGGGDSGGETSGSCYDYRVRLDRVIYYLSVIASTLGLVMGLFLWRLVVLSRNQREL